MYNPDVEFFMQICPLVVHLRCGAARLDRICNHQYRHCECDQRILLLPRIAKSSADYQLGRALASRARSRIHVYRARASHGFGSSQCHCGVGGWHGL